MNKFSWGDIIAPIIDRTKPNVIEQPKSEDNYTGIIYAVVIIAVLGVLLTIILRK